MKKHPQTSALLLAGGVGARMGMQTPKQFLPLRGKPVALYSFELLLSLEEIDEIVVVCAEEFRSLFSASKQHKKVVFALPGNRRQDSVLHGLRQASKGAALVCIHDAARPLINDEMVKRVLAAAEEWGAAAAGMPMRSTVKEVTVEGFVARTHDRSLIWEIQTPQAAYRELLERGFDYAEKHGLTVTDDVSLVELIGGKVKIVEGSDINIKITVPSDIVIASNFIDTLAP